MATSIHSNSSSSLPSTRHLLTSLLNTIATSTRSEGSHQNSTISADSNTNNNPLLTATQNTKSALLTLHSLFPNDLLPALDQLDRGLVTRFVLAPTPQTEEGVSMEVEDLREQLQHFSPENQRKKITAAYHVRSAQQQRNANSRSRHHGPANQISGITYGVRLTAWSCSCPAFAFAAFPPSTSEVLENRSRSEEAQHNETTATPRRSSEAAQLTHSHSQGDEEEAASECFLFGGLTRSGSDVPVCKHLLACVIAELCEGFAGLVEEREVGREEEVVGWAAGWGD